MTDLCTDGTDEGKKNVSFIPACSQAWDRVLRKKPKESSRSRKGKPCPRVWKTHNSRGSPVVFEREDVETSLPKQSVGRREASEKR